MIYYVPILIEILFFMSQTNVIIFYSFVISPGACVSILYDGLFIVMSSGRPQ